jgi:hypothetical protein
MVLNIILLVIMYFVGFGLCSFGMMQIVLCFRTALPMIKAFEQGNAIDGKAARKRMTITISIWLAISAVAICLVLIFCNYWMKVGFFTGIAFCFVFGLSKTTPRAKDNVLDFCLSNQSVIYDRRIKNAIRKNDSDKVLDIAYEMLEKKR